MERPVPADAVAQSTNRGELNGNEIEYFYSFTAGPGEITITLQVAARKREQK
jgi:hypothetical protein